MNDTERILMKIDSSTQSIVETIQNETRRFIVVSTLINDLEKHRDIYSTSDRIKKMEVIEKMFQKEKIDYNDIFI